MNRELELPMVVNKNHPDGLPTYPEHVETVVILIGKCGSGSLRAALKQSGAADKMFIVHVQRPLFRDDLKYIIVARNPLTRVISAFNWRYKRVVIDEAQRNRFPGEYEILRRYGTIGTLGEALYDADALPRHEAFRDARHIHHIREDISFHLTDLLERCSPTQIEAVLMQENLDRDMGRVFGFENVRRIHDNSVMCDRGTLSDRARTNLVRFLHRDYEALTRLWAWGKIDQQSYLQAITY